MFQNWKRIWRFSGNCLYDNITVKGLTPLSYIINADNAAIITECDNQISGNVIIPASINGSVVTGIAEQAFDGCTLVNC